MSMKDWVVFTEQFGKVYKILPGRSHILNSTMKSQITACKCTKI